MRDQGLDHEGPGETHEAIGLYTEGNRNDWRDLLVIYTQICLLVWKFWLQCRKWIKVTLEIKQSIYEFIAMIQKCNES